LMPIPVAVAASLLRGKRASSLDRSALRLRLDSLHDGVRDVQQLFQKAIATQSEGGQKLLAAVAVCDPEACWLPLAATAADFDADAADDAADELVNASLMRVLNREKRGFQLHALMREEVRVAGGVQELEKLQRRHAEALLALSDRWREMPLWLSLSEVNLASKFLTETNDVEAALALYRKQEALWAALGHKEYLPITYWAEAQLLHPLRRFEEELTVLEKQEAICLEVGDKETLRRCYPLRALALQEMNRSEEALALITKQEAMCLAANDKEALQVGYQVYVMILEGFGRTEDALSVMKKAEAVSLEL